jgi:uncharacterized membrane protein
MAEDQREAVQQYINDASARVTTGRPHRALRTIAACGAALAAVAIALMAAAIVNNWQHVPLDQVPWLPLAMLLSMLALLSSGIVLMRRVSDVALVVFITSALLGLPFTLFGLGLALAD